MSGLAELARDVFALVDFINPIDDDPNVALLGISAVHLEHGEGITDRGRLVGGDEKSFVGGDNEVEHLSTEPRAGVDENYVGKFVGGGEFFVENFLFLARKIERALYAARAADVIDPEGRVDDNVFELDAVLEQIEHISMRHAPEDHVDVGHADIGVDQQRALIHELESDCEIDGDICFADAALAAGDRDYARRMLFAEHL